MQKVAKQKKRILDAKLPFIIIQQIESIKNKQSCQMLFIFIPPKKTHFRPKKNVYF